MEERRRVYVLKKKGRRKVSTEGATKVPRALGGEYDLTEHALLFSWKAALRETALQGRHTPSACPCLPKREGPLARDPRLLEAATSSHSLRVPPLTSS